MNWRSRSREVFQRTAKVNAFPDLDADFEEALSDIYKAMGSWKHFAKYDTVFSLYWDRSIDRHFRIMAKYRSQYAPSEFRKRAEAIKDYVKGWDERISGNGAEDSSAEFERGLYGISLKFTPEKEKGAPECSTVFPRRLPKRRHQNNDFDIER